MTAKSVNAYGRVKNVHDIVVYFPKPNRTINHNALAHSYRLISLNCSDSVYFLSSFCQFAQCLMIGKFRFFCSFDYCGFSWKFLNCPCPQQQKNVLKGYSWTFRKYIFVAICSSVVVWKQRKNSKLDFFCRTFDGKKACVIDVMMCEKKQQQN